MKRIIPDCSIINIDLFLDITMEICPLTFVKTKLLIEKMAPGQVAQVRLKGAEPLENIPRSVCDLGHTVISLEAEESDLKENSIFKLLIRKNSQE